MTGPTGRPDDAETDWPIRVSDDPTSVEFEVLTTSGRTAAVRIRVRLDVVEVWRDQRNVAVFDRDRLRAWLDTMPDQPLAVDEVELLVDRTVDVQGRVAIGMLDIGAWTFSPVMVMKLRERVG